MFDLEAVSLSDLLSWHFLFLKSFLSCLGSDGWAKYSSSGLSRLSSGFSNFYVDTMRCSWALKAPSKRLCRNIRIELADCWCSLEVLASKQIDPLGETSWAGQPSQGVAMVEQREGNSRPHNVRRMWPGR